MKKQFKKTLCLLLAVSMTLLVVGCGGSGSKTSNKVEKVNFPLKEKVEFTFMIEGTEPASFKKDMAKNELWTKLEKETNVHINFQFLGDNPNEKLSLLISSDNYGDVLWGGPILNSVEASKYIAAGKLADITDYIKEDIMPELSSDLKENSEIKKMITASDGRIYTLPKITGLEGNYLESPIWINKAWLDKLGLAIPKTLDEFTNVLRAFSKNDPNGNGVPDEIPYICSTSSTSMHLEALLGIFGCATKDGVNDAFVQVKNGKVEFVPTTNAYKDYIKYMSQLYSEGLIWSECFTSNTSTLNAKLTSKTCVVGCFTANTPVETTYSDDYVCIAPPVANGYTPCWYYHPAINGSKNQFFVMDKCNNLSVLMAWVDKLYDLDNAMAYDYGTPNEGRITYSDNKYSFVDLDDAQTAALDKSNPTLYSLIGNAVRSITVSDFENKVNLSKSYSIFQNNYKIYEDVISKELWTRPYYAPEDSYDADTYTTDINYQVTTHRASWITGKTNVDDEWDGFVKKIDSLGLKKFLKILQNAYDVSNK